MKNCLPLFPLFLSLENQCCLVVGLGNVGQRKLNQILVCKPAHVLVLDVTAPPSKALFLLEDACVHFEQRPCLPEDIMDKLLVIAATDNKKENMRIAELCRKKGVLCNCATPPGSGNFFLPAVARQGPLTLALSTSGASPALAQQWRDELNAWLIPRKSIICLLQRLRPLILDLPGDAKKNSKILQKLTTSPLQQWMKEGNLETFRKHLAAQLPAELHSHLPPLLTELFDDLT